MYCIAAVLIVATTDLLHAQTLEERFLAEAPQAWSKYREKAWLLEGGHSHSLWNSLAGSLEEVTTQRRTNLAGCQYLSAANRNRVGQKETYIETAVVKNSNYMFRLRKQSPHSTWALTDTYPLSDTESVQNELYNLRLNDRISCNVLYADNFYLGDLVEDSGFKLDRCENVLHRGVNVVKVVFTYTPASTTGNRTFRSLRGGHFLLDPLRHWCLRGYELLRETQHGKAVIRMDVHEMKASDDGIPLSYTRTYEQEGDFQGQAFRVTGTSKYDFRFPDKDAPESAFTLPAFGLPEPWELQQKASPPTRWFLWLTLVGVALLVLGAFFYYRVRRRTA